MATSTFGFAFGGYIYHKNVEVGSVGGCTNASFWDVSLKVVSFALIISAMYLWMKREEDDKLPKNLQRAQFRSTDDGITINL